MQTSQNLNELIIRKNQLEEKLSKEPDGFIDDILIKELMEVNNKINSLVEEE